MIKKNNINGILLLDKPISLSSNHAIQKIKRHFNIKKLGHTGTLDPLATGLLPVCMGNATRISQFLIDSDKTYDVEIKLGLKTTTGDKEGDIIEEALIDKGITEQTIREILMAFLGDQMQIPPMYSAIKHNGQRLYKLANKGIKIERKSRNIKIYALDLISFNKDILRLTVQCSKGTYIRTLAEDISEKLNTVGHVYSLRRLSIDLFSNHEMHSFDKIMGSENLHKYLLPIDAPLMQLNQVDITEEMSKDFCNGIYLDIRNDYYTEDQFLRIYNHKKDFLGLGQYCNQQIKPKKVMCNNN